MGQPIVIDLSKADDASSLQRELALEFRGQVFVDDARVVVSGGRPPDRLVVDVLDAVRTWLDASPVGSVVIRIDGRNYTLAAQRELRPSEAPA